MRLFKTTLPAQSFEDEAAAVRLLAITNRTRNSGLLAPNVRFPPKPDVSGLGPLSTHCRH